MNGKRKRLNGIQRDGQIAHENLIRPTTFSREKKA
jgi:hypothetical protein